MGGPLFPYAQRALVAVVVALVVALPLPSLHFGSQEVDRVVAPSEPLDRIAVQLPAPQRYVDPLGVAIAPPAGWVMAPATSLNPVTDPPEPVQELARFQVRVSDAPLYSAPIAITSGLVADAIAVLSIGVARDGSDILTVDREARGEHLLASVPGFTMFEDETTYEGLHVLTRYLFSRDTARVLVAKAAALEDDWVTLAPALRNALDTFGGDPEGANAPAAVIPPTPTPAPEAATDPTVAVRNAIIERAASLLGLRYVWGGNSTVAGMDCSAYVSWVWSVPRYTTDSIWRVSSPITKEDLRPGDALDLTTGTDPRHLGHIRLFDAWANAEHSAMWVYEETPPQVVHRVVAYDARYQLIRLDGLSGAGVASVIPGVAQPDPVALAPRATRRPTYRATPTPAPTRRYTTTPRPPATPRPTPTPTTTPRPTATWRPTWHR